MSVITTIAFFLLPCLLRVASSDLGVCQTSETGSVRIAGLNSSYVGFVEICRDGLWIPVSYEDEDEWTKKNSFVVCGELGFLGAIQVMNNEGPVPPEVSTTDGVSVGWQYYSVECNGLETHLADCSWTIKNVKKRKKDVIVVCTNELGDGELQVVGGSGNDGEGIVLIYSDVKNYGWSPVCVNEWEDVDARVACRQLGYVDGHYTAYSPDEVLSPNKLSRKRYSHFGCSGDENKLTDCSFVGPYPYKCQSTNYAGISCNSSDDGNTILRLNISLLVLMVVISLLLILILILLLRCTVIKFGKKSSSSGRHSRRHNVQHNNRESMHGSSRIVHTELDLEAPYAANVTIAPPTYAETLLADQMVQSTQNSDIEDSVADNEYDQDSAAVERSRSISPLVRTIGNGSEPRVVTLRHLSTSYNSIRESSSPSPSEEVGNSLDNLIPCSHQTF